MFKVELGRTQKKHIFPSASPICDEQTKTKHTAPVFSLLNVSLQILQSSSDLAHLQRQCVVLLKDQCILYGSKDGFVAVKKSIWFLKLNKHCFIK